MSECSDLDENVSMVEEKATKLHMPQDTLRETIDDLRDRVDKIKSDANELLQKLQVWSNILKSTFFKAA